MLRGMRKASSNWIGKTIMAVVMGVLIISFGIWGIADIFRGFGQSTVAKIGRTEISMNEFRQLYTDRLQQLGRQFGRPLTMDQARAFGLDRQVLQQTIAEAALNEEARRLGCVEMSFPSISTGAFGYPVAEAAQIALRSIADLLYGEHVHSQQLHGKNQPSSQLLNKVRFVLFDPHTHAAYAKAAKNLATEFPHYEIRTVTNA